MTDRSQPYEAIIEKIRAARNFDFRNYKRATLQRRVEHRMREVNCRSVDDYAALLDRDPAEFDALVGRLLIRVTSFFRDMNVWQTLSRKVLPDLLAHKNPQDEVRVWCAGCSTGEEAFSVAILIAEALGPAFATFPIKIFGTDVHEAAVAYARRGIYTAEQVQGVPKAWLARYFTRGPEGYAVRKEIRRVVVFGVNNLVSDAPISRLDMVICRNVFIYLDNVLQKRVLTRFHYAVRHHGVLVLGKSELIPFAAKVFEPLELSARIYRKDGRRDVPVAAQRLVGLLEQENIARSSGQANEDFSIVSQFYRDLLDSSPLPMIGTGLDGTITFWSQAAARLWGRPEPETVGKKLPMLGLAGIGGDLLVEKTAAVREGLREREASDVTMTPPGQNAPMSARIEVSPLRDLGRELVGMLYVVHDVTVQRRLEDELRFAHGEVQTANEKLQTSVEELRSSNEELETTNEELQSANEELQTTNEELQSTNEELETTNEELQSTNAELDATNHELAHRTEETHLLGLYQRTIVRSLSAAVVVLDAHGRITSWNLAAERLLGLPEREAVGQLIWSMHIPALKRPHLLRIRRALANNRSLRGEQLSYELPTGGRGFATVAAVPLVEEQTTMGAIILFEDTTRSVRLTRELESALSKKPPAKKG